MKRKAAIAGLIALAITGGAACVPTNKPSTWCHKQEVHRHLDPLYYGSHAWTTPDGRVVGWSWEEDSILYRLPQAMNRCPDYPKGGVK